MLVPYTIMLETQALMPVLCMPLLWATRSVHMSGNPARTVGKRARSVHTVKQAAPISRTSTLPAPSKRGWPRQYRQTYNRPPTMIASPLRILHFLPVETQQVL